MKQAICAFVAFSLTVPNVDAAAARQDSPSARSWEVYSDLKARPESEAPPLFSDANTLEAYVDKHLGNRMKEAHIPGAVFLAIKDGKVVLQKAYGVTNLDTMTPVDPDDTMFYVASVSKTFIGTTVMRLVDKGIFSLDDEISALAPSIDLSRHMRYDAPVTLRHALIHTTGFRDIFLNSSAPHPEKQEPLRQALRNYLSQQGARPGEYTYYCNAGIAMAAAAIEDATGRSYADVLQEEVFDPLDMTNAKIAAPDNNRKAAFQKHLITPYIYDDKTDTYLTQPPFIRNLYATGGIAASTGSIANYMRMHMDGGRFNGKPFLSPASHREMHTRQSSNHPRIPGYRLTFKEGVRNGVAYHGHSGDYRGNDTTMMFVPAYDFAFFLSYTGDNNTFYREFINDLFDTAFTRQKETVVANTSEPGELQEYEGSYTNFRYDEPTPIQLIWPLLGQFAVQEDADGLLKIDYPGFYFKGATVRYARVGDDLFRKVDPGTPGRIGDLLVDYLVFMRDEAGRPKAFASSVQNHSFTMTRVGSWAESGNFSLLLTFARYGMMAILAAGLLIWTGRIAAHYLFKRKLQRPFALNIGLLAAWLSAATGLGFLLAFFQTLASVMPINLTYGFDDLGLGPWFVLPLLSTLLFAVAAVALVRPGKTHRPAFATRLLMLAALAPLAVWVFIAFKTNLLSFYFS